MDHMTTCMLVGSLTMIRIYGLLIPRFHFLVCVKRQQLACEHWRKKLRTKMDDCVSARVCAA